MPSRTTLIQVLEDTAKQYGDAPALHQPNGDGTGYKTYSWADWLQGAREIALGLQSLGFNKGDVACSLTETRAEFYIIDIGVMAAGGVSGALYVNYPIADQAKNIRAVRPAAIFVENPKALDALQGVVENDIRPQYIVITGEAEGAITLEQLRQAGRELAAKDPEAFERRRQEITPDDSAILYLTSGATGEPKMGVTTHKAAVSNIDAGPYVLPITPSDSTVVFLPSAHIAQRIAMEMLPMSSGTPVWFSESLSKLPGELKRVQPTVFLAPPRVWERMYATICNEVRKRPAPIRRLFYGALGLGVQVSRYRLGNRPIPGWKKKALQVADKVIFNKVRERLGGRLKVAISGAAPLGKDLAEFFAGIGMPLVEGYGLTEAGIVCFNPIERPKPGSIGRLLPGVEAKLADDGELMLKSEFQFSGYFQDEAATRSVITGDGWFLTGDIAEVDSEGYWSITGRKKELIVSSNGKKIYPARIENLFKLEPLVNQVLLLGDKQPYVTALLTVNAANIQALSGMEGYKGKTVAEQVEAAPVTTALQSAVARINKQLADFERIRRWKVLGREFTIDDGELTPTMKIRRARVIENHRELISELYLGREESN